MSKTNNKAESVKTGTMFGNWKVKRVATKPDYLNCECTCGVRRNVNVYSLTSGKSRSCGCVAKDLSRQTRERRNV